MDLTAMAFPPPPPIPSDEPAGEWVLESGDEDGVWWHWQWEVYVPSPRVEAVLAALQADVRARRQVCRRTHGAQFSESLGIVALARAGRGQ